jgi:glycosyltransferase involved in cell wall biosynthesis
VRCLNSLGRQRVRTVYVDSGSGDGSQDRAQAMGAVVVRLDSKVAFTAARARNAGFEALMAEQPQTEFVQFVDGDCEVVEGWLEAARGHLGAHPSVAVVCGRRRERHPDKSIFNRLCDIEWDTPIGKTSACGGDAMMRTKVFRQVGGFDPALIAGEEPDLCLRIRGLGFEIERIDHEMTLHDADITQVSQWWRRSVRAGHAYAEGAHRSRHGPEPHWQREARRIAVLGGVPVVAILGAVPTFGLSLGLLGTYPLSAYRAFRYERDRGRNPRDAAAYGVACALGKLPEFQGFLRFHLGRVRRRKSGIIEYKAPK